MTRNDDGTPGAWFSPDEDARDQGDPMTLVTLSLDSDVDEAALGFIEGAERRALGDWAARGTVLMAFVTHDGRELNLVVASNDDDARRTAEELPSVMTELADVHVRSITALELALQRKLVTH